MATERISDEEGVSLIELVTTVALLSVVLAIFFSGMLVMQGAVAEAGDRSISNDQARLAVQQIDREVRSGNVLYEPTDSGMKLVIYTQSHAATDGNQCVQWRIADTELQTRSWSPNWETDGEVSGWRTVASDVVNDTVDPKVPAFTLPDDSPYGDRLMHVVILVGAGEGSEPVRIEQSVTGRNTSYGYPASVCDNIPSPT